MIAAVHLFVHLFVYLFPNYLPIYVPVVFMDLPCTNSCHNGELVNAWTGPRPANLGNSDDGKSAAESPCFDIFQIEFACGVSNHNCTFRT